MLSPHPEGAMLTPHREKVQSIGGTDLYSHSPDVDNQPLSLRPQDRKVPRSKEIALVENSGICAIPVLDLPQPFLSPWLVDVRHYCSKEDIVRLQKPKAQHLDTCLSAHVASKLERNAPY